MRLILIVNRRPPSLATKGKGKEAMRQAIEEAILKQTAASFHDQKNLYIRIIWFTAERGGPDTDNIAKTIIDSLKGIAFEDDRQIKRCLVERVDLSDSPELTFSNSSPDEISDRELLESISEHSHTLYIEVGKCAAGPVRLGPIDEV